MFLNLFKKENFAQTHSIYFEFGSDDDFNKVINVGDTINWHWDDDMPHSIVNVSVDPDTINFPLIESTSTSNTATATFTEEGEYSYECGVHGSNMSGMITVVEPTRAPTTTARQTTRAPTTTARQTTRAPTTTPSPSVSGTSGTSIVTTAAPISSTSAGPSTPAPQTPPTLPKNINGGMIAGIVVSCIVVSIIGYYAYKRRRSNISP